MFGEKGYFASIPPLVNEKGVVKYFKVNPNCPKWIRRKVSRIEAENLQRVKLEG